VKNIDTLPNCEICSLRYKTVFKNLTNEELDSITFEKGCNFYKRGNIIYHEGNRGNGIYCVNRGIIKLYKTGSDGKEQIIRFAKAGDIIAYRSILSNEPACTTAKVIEDADLCFIPAKTLLSLVESNSDFSMELIKLSCKELGEANKFILDIAQKTVRERLAEVLLILKESFGIDSDNVLQVLLTREELANIVGTATESVIRLLSEFKTDKVIELNGRRIKLIDIKKLDKISNVY
jgi:CRP-like cAMP-binding protein